jgi:hypothetical protein
MKYKTQWHGKDWVLRIGEVLEIEEDIANKLAKNKEKGENTMRARD